VAGWQAWLGRRVAEGYLPWQRLAQALACLDALHSLAAVARLPGYCRPELVRRPFLSRTRSILTESFLCHACSC
jgi:DNA mismatch repair ATPase MutS